MNVLRAIRDDPDGFLLSVDDILELYIAIDSENKSARKRFFYYLREQYWNNPNDAMLFSLMCLGFNDIWQTCKASHGLYGTPAGLLNHVSMRQIVIPENLHAWSGILQDTSIQDGDYKDVIMGNHEHNASNGADTMDGNAGNGDKHRLSGTLIFCDPPYRDSFTRYGTGFDDTDHEALCEWCLDSADEGAIVLLSNRRIKDDSDDLVARILGDRAVFNDYDVTYIAGRRARRDDGGYDAKPAVEFLAVIR